MDMPRRSRSNGRHGSGSRSLRALKPMKQMRVSASTPPASATGASPAAIRSAAMASDAAPELHAVTSVSRGPPSPRALPRTAACDRGSVERSPRVCFGRSPAKRDQYHPSASSIPPPTAPTISAASARSSRPSPASASASRAAARASRSARERRGEPATRSGTSAAIRQRKPSVTMSVTGRIAQAPATRPFQYAFTPAPNGLMTPRPLTTTDVTRSPPGRRCTGRARRSTRSAR